MENEPAPRPLSPSDQALILAARVWGGEVSASFWQRFKADHRASLLRACEASSADGLGEGLTKLRHLHESQARPDFARVHVSWWIQSLKSETRSVQRAVAANLPQGIASAVRDGLSLSEDDLKPDSAPYPVALQTALALWTARLIGDLPRRDDDPLVILAMTRFDSGTLARLVHTAGLAKRALIPGLPSGLTTNDQPRLEWLRKELIDVDPRFVQVVERDLDSVQGIGRAGLTTFARLLSVADLYRARWALQQLPYTTARSIRTLMGPEGRRTPMLARWEGDLLRVAVKCLRVEGRIGSECEESAP